MFDALGNLMNGGKKIFSFLDWSGYTAGRPAWPQRDFETITKEGYLENAVGFACVNEIAKACGGIPMRVVKVKADGTEDPYVTHPVMDILKRPNKTDAGGQLVEGMITYLLLNGTSYTVKLGKPVDQKLPITKLLGLKNVRPNLVRVVPNILGEPTAFQLGFSDNNEYHPSRIIMLKTFHPTDPVLGLSTMSVAGKDLDVINALMNYVYRLMTRNGRPDGVIINKAGFTDEQYKKFQKQIEEKLNNPNRAGGWHVIEGDADVKEFAFKPGDMTLGPTEVARIRNTCMVFGVPPECIGVAEAKTYSNYQEARKAFYQETVLPWMDILENKLDGELMKDEDGNPLYGATDKLKYDVRGIEALSEDKDKLWTRTVAAEVAGEITNNEWRDMVGMKRSDDDLADVRLVSYSRVPIDELSSGGRAAVAVDPNADPNADTTGKDQTGDTSKKSGHWSKRWTVKDMRSLPMVKQNAGPELWRTFDAARMPFIRSARKVFASQLGADYTEVARRVAVSQVSAITEMAKVVSDVLQASRPEWEQALDKVWMGTGLAFADKVDAGLDTALSAKLQAKPKLQAKRAAVVANRRGTTESWGAYIDNYLKKTQGQKISDISSTTRQRILNVAAQAYDQGLGADGVAAAILAAAPRATVGRALTIARTEVMGASNAGSRAAALSFGVQMKKAWLPTDDDRTREDHIEAGGMPAVAMDTPYSVGGSQLMFPGDSSLGADAKEVVNCRCAETYEVAEEQGDLAEAA